MKRSLSGDWLFRATDEQQFHPAVVPGCQFLDLMKNNIIEDPFFGTNEETVRWVHEKDFLYRKTFVLSENDLRFNRIELIFEMVDTVSEIMLNGNPIGRTKNCHLPYVYDVKNELLIGENTLDVLFFSPKKHVENRYREIPTPMNANGQNGIVHIRKPQCHFGWDWGPVLTPVGLGEVSLSFGQRKRIASPTIAVRKEKNGFVVSVEAENADRIRLTDPEGKREEVVGQTATFLIDRPQLWWTKELSQKNEQPLYTLTAENDEETVEKKIGLRTVELDRAQDAFGHNFRFLLNGIPLFIKGANYIPPDVFLTRFDRNRLNRLLDAVLFSEMNMIRVWGGGYYADDDFLDECDRRGILVWQDFPFACQAYPFFEEGFLQNVLAEVRYNVNRIASHPCLALWCGNNEIEEMHLAWATMKRYVDWTEKFFYHVLPEEIGKIDSATPYTPGSPVGTAHNKNVRSDFVGDTHQWGVWHGLQPMTHYRKSLTRFCSEFGFESLPSFPTVRSYAEPKDYPLASAVQKSHQKCVGGNDKMLRYVAARFPLSEEIEDLVYLTQVTQSACVADAVEHWRRNKGRCNGALYWQLNDCWPACSWSSYDYLGRYKALLYAGKNFFAPLSLSLEDDKKRVTVHLLNDLTEEKTVEVEWIRFDFCGIKERMKKTFSIPPLKNKILFSLSTKEMDGRREGLAFRLHLDGKLLMQKTLLLKKEKKLSFPTAPIDIEEEIVDGKKKITLFSTVYQRLVQLENDREEPFSDNYFDLLPGEKKVIYQDSVLPSPLSVRTVANIRPARIIKTFFATIKVYLSIRNLANMLYHARIPKHKE